MLVRQIAYMNSTLDGTSTTDHASGFAECLSCPDALSNADTYRLFAEMVDLDCEEINGEKDSPSMGYK